MKQVAKNESYSRKAIVEGNVAKFEHLTLHKASGGHYLLTTSFDFKDVAIEHILRLAGETLLIRWRTAFKDAETVDDTADKQVVSVKDMLANKKPRMSKAEKVENLAANMTPEEIARTIASLQATVKARKEAAKG